MKVLRCILLMPVLAMLCPLSAADAPVVSSPTSWRNHATLDDKQGNALYIITAITEVSEGADSNFLLVHDLSSGDRFVMTRRFDIENHRSLVEIADITGKRYVRISFAIPSAAKTRTALVEEMRSNPQLLDIGDPLLTIETPSFSYTAKSADLLATRARGRWLSELRESLLPSFLEGVERMRGDLFSAHSASPFYELLGMYLFHSDCPAPADSIAEHAQDPDCAFDKAFGFGCSEKRVERIEKAKREKRVLDKY